MEEHMNFRVIKGQVAGRKHILDGRNCQDSMVSSSLEHAGNTYYYGVVSDGCSAGVRSEMGTHLITSYLSFQIEDLIKTGTAVDAIPTILFKRLIQMLKSIVDGYTTEQLPYQRVIDFISHHLFATVIGYIIGPETTIIFAMGDGVVACNDYVDVRKPSVDANGEEKPYYPAYYALNDENLSAVKERYLEIGGELPNKFDEYIMDTVFLERLAIGTDAWSEELLHLMNFLSNPAIKSLQREMNALSWNDKRFADDASLILVHKVPPATTAEGGSDGSSN